MGERDPFSLLLLFLLPRVGRNEGINKGQKRKEGKEEESRNCLVLRRHCRRRREREREKKQVNVRTDGRSDGGGAIMVKVISLFFLRVSRNHRASLSSNPFPVLRFAQCANEQHSFQDDGAGGGPISTHFLRFPSTLPRQVGGAEREKPFTFFAPRPRHRRRQSVPYFFLSFSLPV